LLLTSVYDSLDNVDFPTRGSLASLTARLSRTGLGAAHNYEQLEGLLVNAQTRGRHTLLGLFQAGYTRDDMAPVERLYQTGGFLRMSGLATDQLSGQHYAVGVLTYYRRMGNVELFPTYLGGSVEIGNAWRKRDDISLDNTLVAGSLFVGASTPLGPLYLGYGRTDNGNGSFYLYLGNPFVRGLLDF
jgi:NTE family protein